MNTQERKNLFPVSSTSFTTNIQWSRGYLGWLSFDEIKRYARLAFGTLSFAALFLVPLAHIVIFVWLGVPS